MLVIVDRSRYLKFKEVFKFQTEVPSVSELRKTLVLFGQEEIRNREQECHQLYFTLYKVSSIKFQKHGRGPAEEGFPLGERAQELRQRIDIHREFFLPPFRPE